MKRVSILELSALGLDHSRSGQVNLRVKTLKPHSVAESNKGFIAQCLTSRNIHAKPLNSLKNMVVLFLYFMNILVFAYDKIHFLNYYAWKLIFPIPQIIKVILHPGRQKRHGTKEVFQVQKICISIHYINKFVIYSAIYPFEIRD